jgi:hypothetical protein
MVGSAEAGQASDGARMVIAETKTLCNERGSAIILPAGRRPPREQVELKPAAEVMIAMSRLNCYLLHSWKSYLWPGAHADPLEGIVRPGFLLMG